MYSREHSRGFVLISAKSVHQNCSGEDRLMLAGQYVLSCVSALVSNAQCRRPPLIDCVVSKAPTLPQTVMSLNIACVGTRCVSVNIVWGAKCVSANIACVRGLDVCQPAWWSMFTHIWEGLRVGCCCHCVLLPRMMKQAILEACQRTSYYPATAGSHDVMMSQV